VAREFHEEVPVALTVGRAPMLSAKAIRPYDSSKEFRGRVTSAVVCRIIEHASAGPEQT
jgi:hypothetical protein